MKIKTAVIIAGGKGTRLSEYTNEIPKPMLPIKGKPVLEYQIEEFIRYGVNEIIITVGYLKDVIINHLGDGSRYGINIKYIEEKTPLGTAGALFYLKHMLSQRFFVVYGDVMFNLNLDKMAEAHLKEGSDITLFAHPNSHPYDSDIVVCEADYTLKGFLKKNEDRTGTYYKNLVNAGFYIIENRCLNYFSELKKCDLERDFITFFINRGYVRVYKTSEYIKDMGTYGRLAEVEQSVERGYVQSRNLENLQKCIFLDRDGTINRKAGLIYSTEQFSLEKCAAEAIKLINSSGYLAIVITNQPVIARNLCSIEVLDNIHKKMETLLGQEGAYLDDIYYCPHHPDGGYPEERKEYKCICECRKPNIELVKMAMDKYNICAAESYFIGDTTTDIQTGINAGLNTILVQTGESGKDEKYVVTPKYVASDLLEAVKHIIEMTTFGDRV
jgi:D,D-heptose 1,7-bisphosphate phosphatase